MPDKKGNEEGVLPIPDPLNISSLSFEEFLHLLEEGIELVETDLEETDLLEETGFKEADIAFHELAARVRSGLPLHGGTDFQSDTGVPYE